MSPRRPAELVNASVACAEAWAKRDAMIDNGDEVGVQAMNKACDILDERYNALYRQWQKLGGTSNIESLALYDPRTPAQIDWDEHAAEVVATQRTDSRVGWDWDFTPLPKDMPDIDFDTIDEIPF